MIKIKQSIILSLEDYTTLLECKKRYDETKNKYSDFISFGRRIQVMRKLKVQATSEREDVDWGMNFKLSDSEIRIIDDFIDFYNNDYTGVHLFNDIDYLIDAIVNNTTDKFEIIIEV